MDDATFTDCIGVEEIIEFGKSNKRALNRHHRRRAGLKRKLLKEIGFKSGKERLRPLDSVPSRQEQLAEITEHEYDSEL